VTLLKHAYGKKQRSAVYYESLQSQSLKLQKRVSEVIKHLVFDEESSKQPILAAIVYFRQKDGAIGETAPVDFLDHLKNSR